MVATLPFQLQNQSTSSEVYAYITGIYIPNGQRVLLQANGTDLYFPTSPSAVGSALAEDCAIPLGAPGNTVTVTVPQIAGGRVWFSVDSKLTFLLNPGPALVEPSVLNPSDPNANVNFGFCEFTLNDSQLYANISYVDFVSNVPIAITLQNTAGAIQHVSGTATDGLSLICSDLRAQAAKDGKPWDKLIVQVNGQDFRALNPSHSDAVSADFSDYYDTYVSSVWTKYASSTFTLDTQASAGTVTGSVDSSGNLEIGGEAFAKPTTADIFGCNTGPFVTGSDATRNAIIPRLAAGFNRSTLVSETTQPSAADTYYLVDPTNHYSRIVHARNLDGKGYAFAYDDVQPDTGVDQSGKVNDGSPALFVVAVGGGNAYVGDTLDAAAASAREARIQQMKPVQRNGDGGQQPMQQNGVAQQQNDGDAQQRQGHGGLRGKFDGFKQKFLH